MKRRPASTTPPDDAPLTEAAFQRRIAELLHQFARTATANVAPAPRSRSFVNRSLAEATREFQRDMVRQALDAHAQADGKWNISATARALGVARSHIYTLLDELDLRQDSGLPRRRRGTNAGRLGTDSDTAEAPAAPQVEIEFAPPPDGDDDHDATTS